MIVGTAGHIDHGKTTLVRALTGVDADRLPEEKKRGLTIELGYAFMDTPGGARIGFVDVPGHEKLVHTMVAGASGIDFALLLVAADDGPMPQTREHLAVLTLLGIGRGAVVITKADRAPAERVEEVRREMQTLLAGTPLANVPILAVSAQSGAGLEALRELLFDAAATEPSHPRNDALAFRLAIDRVFTLTGAGTVITGTIHAGSVRVGDELAVAPAARDVARKVRVRSVHAQDQAVVSAHAGQRCALALAGLARDAIERGQWLVDPRIALATERIDARLTLWHGETRALRSGARLQAHLGAGHVGAALALLDADVLAPGSSARVQLVLDAAVAAWHGERFILRDPAANRTLAGGVVLDPFAPARYRRTPQRLAELAALELPTAAGRIGALIARAPFGLALDRARQAQGLAELPTEALAGAEIVEGQYALGHDQARGFAVAALAALADFHARQPDELGPDRARWRRLAAPRLPQPLWDALVAHLAESGKVRLHGPVAHLPEHDVQLSATETRLVEKIMPQLFQAGFSGAWARDLARDAGESESLVRMTLVRLARRGELHQIVKDLYYAPETVQRLAALARDAAAAGDGEFTAATFRDATGLGRKRAIQILEYFDRVGVTRRVADSHRLRADCALFS